MRKTTDAVPQWQREDESIDFEAQEEGAEKYGNDGRFDGSADEGTDELAYRQQRLLAAVPRQDAAAPPTTTEEHKKKPYPTTEQAIRTLALHTGLGYILGFGVGLVGKAQSIFRVTRMVGAENAHTHYMDPFAVAGEFARPLFMVACLEVASMYAGPAAHNLKLLGKSAPLSTTAVAASSPSTEDDSHSEGSGLAWEAYEHSGDEGRAKDEGRANSREELARGTVGRKELTTLDSSSYGEPPEEELA